MTTTTSRPTNQRRAALPAANAQRVRVASLKRDIANGLPVAEILDDPRAGGAYVDRLLLSVPAWGETKVRSACVRAGVPVLKRVRDLSERQRRVLTGASA